MIHVFNRLGHGRSIETYSFILVQQTCSFNTYFTKAARNKAIKSKVKTAVKKVETAVAEKNVEAAKAALHTAIVEISKAGSKGVYHKKTVSRKIARLSKAVDSIA